jgi:hypothetical protein
MALSSVLQRSTGVVLNASINPATARALCDDSNLGLNEAVVITPGVSGYDVVRLLNATFDAQFAAATLLAPVLLGVDDIFFTPLQYPEPAAGL